MPGAESTPQVSEMSNKVDARLRAALQEMDDIMKVSFDGSEALKEEQTYIQVKNQTDDLLKLLKDCGNDQKALEKIPSSTRNYLKTWIMSGELERKSVHSSHSEMNGYIGGQIGGYNEETSGYSSSNHSSTSTADGRQAEIENEGLKKQLRSLQSLVQDSKGQLKVAETRLLNSNEKLIKAEERLHKEQVNKTYMESHKLDLMAEVAELRLRLQTVDNERTDYKDRYEGLQNQVLDLHERLIIKEREITELKSQINRNGYHHQHMNGGSRIPSTSSDSSNAYMGSLDREGLRRRRQNSEVESLKKVVGDLMAASQQKDIKINELRKAVSTYQRVEEIILQSHGRPRSSGSESCGSTNDRTVVRPPDQPDRPTSASSNRQNNGFPAMTSTPVAGNGHVVKDKPPAEMNQLSTIASTPTSSNPAPVKRSNSYDAAKFHKAINEVPPQNQGSKTPSMIRKHSTGTHNVKHVNGRFPVTNGGLGRVPVAPAEAETDATTDDEDHQTKDDHKKKKGIKKFFAKLKRSSSQEAIDDLGKDLGANHNFKRGGVRSTAGPRLGWGVQRPSGRLGGAEEPRTPFKEWTAQQVASWLTDMGLTIYASECKRWNKSGKQILEASQQEIDKELRIANPLHRKKLHLALEAERSGSQKDKLCYNMRADWVSKWLDDIGLPQYKDQFFEARVDSRMLNFITVEDLLYMKITNALHHHCIRRGIEVLRKHNFNLSSLKRRPSVTSESVPATQDPTLWTNHRVMEWLRSIDLSEYAANLRGSGVHGALIMLEPKFTVEHLATVLNIPASKTLLRRHLLAHFVNLIGKDRQDAKTGAENGLRLEVNTKVKSKKNPFKKGRSGASDYLCPLDLEQPIDAQAEDKRIKDAVAMYKKELNKAEKPDRQV